MSAYRRMNPEIAYVSHLLEGSVFLHGREGMYVCVVQRLSLSNVLWFVTLPRVVGVTRPRPYESV